MNSRNQSYVIYLLLFVAIIAMLIYNFNSSSSSQEAITINELSEAVKSGSVAKIVEDENTLKITYNDGTQKTSNKETSATLVEQLLHLGVNTEQLAPSEVKIEIKPPVHGWVYFQH